MAGGIRSARPYDAASIAAIYAPYVLKTAISFEDTPPTAGEMADRIVSTQVTCPFLVSESDGEVLGYAYAGPHRARAAYRWSVDVTVYVAAGAHRRGVGRSLYVELLDRLVHQGFHSAFAGIALPNDKSVGLHESLGFEHLGTYKEVGFNFDQWHDVGWWRTSINCGLPLSDPLPPTDVDR